MPVVEAMGRVPANVPRDVPVVALLAIVIVSGTWASVTEPAKELKAVPVVATFGTSKTNPTVLEAVTVKGDVPHKVRPPELFDKVFKVVTPVVVAQVPDVT